ncbi:hypothetical protein AB0L70_36440 [Kribbella sp. NPDC051952]|uniref:hypothetical protein n=1 Tax=Kribbella sp. NPDC051952 TaxID=3154851 RepID=UPI00344AF492
MEMIRRFDAETFARGLADWAWLIGDRDLRPIAASMFGDVFLQGPDGVWFLDSLEGTLTLEWPDAEALQGALNTPEGQDQYLLGGIAIGAQQRGVVPGPSQVLMFSVHPALGGEITSGNVEAMDYVVASSICGQLRRQLKDLPPGSPITEISLKK